MITHKRVANSIDINLWLTHNKPYRNGRMCKKSNAFGQNQGGKTRVRTEYEMAIKEHALIAWYKKAWPMCHWKTDMKEESYLAKSNKREENRQVNREHWTNFVIYFAINYNFVWAAQCYGFIRFQTVIQWLGTWAPRLNYKCRTNQGFKQKFIALQCARCHWMEYFNHKLTETSNTIKRSRKKPNCFRTHWIRVQRICTATIYVLDVVLCCYKAYFVYVDTNKTNFMLRPRQSQH